MAIVRLSTGMIYQRGLDGILSQEAALSRAQQQLASGKRVLTPADDPLAAALAVNVGQTESMNNVYASNRATATQALGASDTALGSIIRTIQGVLTDVVASGNGTYSDADRKTMVAQLTAARDELLARGNATDGNGQYLYSGHLGSTVPFVLDPATGNVTYQGDDGARIIQADQSRQISSSDTGVAIFSQAVAGTVSYITSAASTNTGTGLFSAASFTPGGANVGDNFEIQFSLDGGGALQYSVVTTPADGTPPVTTPPVPFVDGATINMGGVSVKISGTPADGDSFSVKMPDNDNMNMFNTLNSLIQALGVPSNNDPVAAAGLTNMLATANKSLKLNLDNVLVVAASVGTRMNEIGSLDQTGADRGIAYTKQLSSLEDVDVFTTTTEILLRKTAMEAAMAVMTMTKGLSLFNR